MGSSKKKTQVLLEEAFERLVAGQPTHPDLKTKALEGKRLVNFLNVALEADVSRRLIAYEGCPYPEVRGRILAYLASAPTGQATPGLVKALRAEMRELQRQLELRDTYNAELLLELEQLQKSRGGYEIERDNVTNFRTNRRRKENRPPG